MAAKLSFGQSVTAVGRTVSDLWYPDAILDDTFRGALLSPAIDGSLAYGGNAGEQNVFSQAMAQAGVGNAIRPWAPAAAGGNANLMSPSNAFAMPANFGHAGMMDGLQATQLPASINPEGFFVPLSADGKASMGGAGPEDAPGAVLATAKMMPRGDTMVVKMDDISEAESPNSTSSVNDRQRVPQVASNVADYGGSVAAVPTQSPRKGLMARAADLPDDLAAQSVAVNELRITPTLAELRHSYYSSLTASSDDESALSNNRSTSVDSMGYASSSTSRSRSSSSRDNRPKSNGSRPAGSPNQRSPDEVATLASRRQERNRVAARRSREKKKEYVQELEATAHALVCKNKELLREVRKLKKEIADLKGIPFEMPDEPLGLRQSVNRRGTPTRAAAAAASTSGSPSMPAAAASTGAGPQRR